MENSKDDLPYAGSVVGEYVAEVRVKELTAKLEAAKSRIQELERQLEHWKGIADEETRLIEVAREELKTAESCMQELNTQHRMALRAFYDLFGRLGLTMINECTLEQCLVSGEHEIDSLQAAASELRKLRDELKEGK